MFTKPWSGHVNAERVSKAGELDTGSCTEGTHQELGQGGVWGSLQTTGCPPCLENATATEIPEATLLPDHTSNIGTL